MLDWRYLDPRENRILPAALGGQSRANLLTEPVKIPPQESVGYRFELVHLSEILLSERFTGDVPLSLVLGDRSGRTYKKSFAVDTDLWGPSDGAD